MKAAFIALLLGMAHLASVQPVLAADAVTYKEKVLYSFCSQQNCTDGASPFGSLIDVSGTLYGATEKGGGAGCGGEGCGTVFSIDPSTGVEKVLYSFLGGSDGAAPEAGLIAVNGLLYGTTFGGGITTCGSTGCGTMFSIDPNTGAKKTIYYFCTRQNCTDGANPFAGLVEVKGTLYGTTGYGGNNYYGTVFMLNLSTGAEKVLYSFCALGGDACTDGATPAASLIDVNGTLYGTTVEGGKYGGTVFALNRKTGAERVLYSFCSQANCADGQSPFAGLINVKGTLFGATEAGGGSGCGGGCGTVFSINPSTGEEAVLHSFSGGSDGAGPQATLIDLNGTLYGTTALGGGAGCSSGCGTAFSIDRNTGTENVLYAFCSHQNCNDGAVPGTSLLAVNSKLYGTTLEGGGTGCGGFGCGTVFLLKKQR